MKAIFDHWFGPYGERHRNLIPASTSVDRSKVPVLYLSNDRCHYPCYRAIKENKGQATSWHDSSVLISEVRLSIHRQENLKPDSVKTGKFRPGNKTRDLWNEMKDLSQDTRMIHLLIYLTMLCQLNKFIL